MNTQTPQRDYQVQPTSGTAGTQQNQPGTQGGPTEGASGKQQPWTKFVDSSSYNQKSTNDTGAGHEGDDGANQTEV